MISNTISQEYNWNIVETNCALYVQQPFYSALDLSLFDLYFPSGTLNMEIFPVSFIEEVSFDEELFSLISWKTNSESVNAKNFHLTEN